VVSNDRVVIGEGLAAHAVIYWPCGAFTRTWAQLLDSAGNSVNDDNILLAAQSGDVPSSG
jgi:hypothetical protein